MVVADVAAETTVVGVPAKAVRAKSHLAQTGFLAYGTTENIPDPVARALEKMLGQVQELDSRMSTGLICQLPPNLLLPEERMQKYKS